MATVNHYNLYFSNTNCVVELFTHAQLLECLLIGQDLCQHSPHCSSHLSELLQERDLRLQLLQDFLQISLS